MTSRFLLCTLWKFIEGGWRRTGIWIYHPIGEWRRSIVTWNTLLEDSRYPLSWQHPPENVKHPSWECLKSSLYPEAKWDVFTIEVKLGLMSMEVSKLDWLSGLVHALQCQCVYLSVCLVVLSPVFLEGCPSYPIFLKNCSINIYKKNPAYGRHWISRPLRIVAPHMGDTNSLNLCG